MIIRIDRSRPQRPSAILGAGWRFAEQDERSLLLPVIDTSKIILKECYDTMGYERFTKLKREKNILLDLAVLQTFCKKEDLFQKNGKKNGMDFLNTFFSLDQLLKMTEEWNMFYVWYTKKVILVHYILI